METVLGSPSLRELSPAELADVNGGGLPEIGIKIGRAAWGYAKTCLLHHAQEFIECAVDGYKKG